MACAIVVLAVPRPVQPSRLPPLVLDVAAVREALEQDRVLARRAPTSPELDQLQALLMAEGEAERMGPAGVPGTSERRQRIRSLSARLFRKLGPEGVSALRARSTQRAMSAMAGELEDEREASGLLGTLPELLRRYGLVRDDGSARAPELSLRATYKARWNLIHELPVRSGFARVELHAYEGWIALHATNLSPQRRAEAARAFYLAGGNRSGEALAIWLFRAGQLGDARRLMDQALARRAELRARNMSLYLALALAAEAE